MTEMEELPEVQRVRPARELELAACWITGTVS